MLTSILLLSLLTVAMTSYTCDDNKYSNGCTVPKGFNWKKNQFKKACNRHDICYYCGHTLKVPRKACDSKFRREMRSTCRRKKKGIKNIIHNIRRQECLRAADVYHSAVSVGGVLPMFWEYRNYRFCRRAWVKDCMP